MGKVIVTGTTGQDGSWMVDFLLRNTKHEVYGGVRRLSVKNHKNIEHVDNPRFKLIDLDVTDAVNISGVVDKIRPDYFINLAANSFVGSSWDMPANHFQTNTMGVMYQLEAIRKFAPKCRYYNAGSSEEFGDVLYTPQDENHPLRPRSPYGASKASARHIVKVYRESYGLYAVQGWLFNHESERRGEEFVTRKITKTLAKTKKDLDQGLNPRPLRLGNLNARRDWSHAEDFVWGIWLMLQQDTPQDYVLSSGETHTVRDFVFAALKYYNIEGEWVEFGLDEKFIRNGQVLVEVDPKFYRPAEVELLQGCSSKAEKELNWSPMNSFDELVARMCQHDFDSV